MKIRIPYLLCFAISACVLAAPAVSGKALERPNIVFILVDDLGWSDVGCYGATFHETPNIDKLAQLGTRFRAAYAASPVCSPTRASILTGKYPARINFWRATPTENLPHQEVTLPEALKKAGYRTAHMGKWHMMLHGEKGQGHEPQGHGYNLKIGGHDAGQPSSFFFPYKRDTKPKNDVPHMRTASPGTT